MPIKKEHMKEQRAQGTLCSQAGPGALWEGILGRENGGQGGWRAKLLALAKQGSLEKQ